MMAQHSHGYLGGESEGRVMMQDVPDGYVIVPREPTRAMHIAAWAAMDNGMKPGADWEPFNAEVYAAMLSAAPAKAVEAPADWVLMRQAIGNLRVFITGMDESNWRDMRQHAERQLDDLSRLILGGSSAAPTK